MKSKNHGNRRTSRNRKSGLLSDWGFEGEGLVINAKKLIKVFFKSYSIILDSDRTLISMVYMADRN